MHDSITTEYEKCDPVRIKEVNAEAAVLADTLPVGDNKTLADRVDIQQKNECFVSFKDHKPGFPGRIETRLINPSQCHSTGAKKSYFGLTFHLRPKKVSWWVGGWWVLKSDFSVSLYLSEIKRERERER